ncbi:phosphohistidine phosphatase [Halospina denitrificans]|uniref:Phosphohistidine phosphatase n=1 Tax=Halospina denitrificans TaxID=332522 RepID=A0A4R7JXE4_9GAMM|nr:histidine phosphatase family protein [Halospina denitrificans]TDT43132.1 phosphohistidine phosphatase [Halospina denitrificans]
MPQTQPQTRILVLIRHAKSSWDDPNMRDFDRPINERGQRDAPDMGARLAARGQRPDRFYCSSARRARETALILAQAVGYPEADLEAESGLYMADDTQLLERIRRFPDSAGEVWLVGHNPDITELVNRLAGFQTHDLPTCAVVRMAFDVGHWKDIEPGKARVLEVDRPKHPWETT